MKLPAMNKQVVSHQSVRSRLAKNLRLLRAHHGLSQEALADLAGLHRTYVGSIERSERNVSIDNIEKLANVFGIDICALLSVSLNLTE